MFHCLPIDCWTLDTFPALRPVCTLRPCVGFCTRTRVSLRFRSVPSALTHVFTCMITPLLLVCGLYSCSLPRGILGHMAARVNEILFPFNRHDNRVLSVSKNLRFLRPRVKKNPLKELFSPKSGGKKREYPPPESVGEKWVFYYTTFR